MGPVYRQRVARPDGRTISVVQRRGHLAYCYGACCCGRTDRGYAPVPIETYKEEWLKRKLRNVVHLTKGGCLGPCPLANVASLEFDGQSVFFHSVSQPWQVRLIFDYIETMIRADCFLPPPPELAVFTFRFYNWDVRPKAAAEDVPGAPVNPSLIAFLTHAGTDLMTLDRARAGLPAELAVLGISLLGISSEEQMLAVLNGDLAQAGVVMLRIHGRLEAVPGIELLLRRCQERDQRLVFVSGTGELDPQMAQAGDTPPDVLQAATSYLMCGGPGNLIECFQFLSDRLLLAAHGYRDPQPAPEHGVYLREIERADVGLPPQPPGTAVASLYARQLWWTATVMATAAGLWLLVGKSGTRGDAARNWPRRIGGAALLILPHLIHVPAATGSNAAPEALIHRFTLLSLAATGVFWLLLGVVGGSLFHHLNHLNASRDPGVADSRPAAAGQSSRLEQM